MNTQDLTKEIKGIESENDALPYIFDYERESFNWSAPTKKEYNKIARQIDKIHFAGKNWKLYCWYDVSSFEYWMIKEKEPNYISITIRVNSEMLTDDEVNEIRNALDAALCKADEIQNDCQEYTSQLLNALYKD